MTDTYSDADLRSILKRTKTIACIGVSPKQVRPSHFVARYLHYRGYRVIPINPGHAGKTLFGEVIRADLSDLAILDAALEHLMPHLQTVWMQIGVEHAEAAAKARANGLTVVQNRCPKIEYQRLFGELRKAGFNTGIISSRL